ncbi:transcriptional regulator, GntR family [Coriobacterium glomerans PW2]|uniref:Transcriptional regulator, GntR family n=1 Tax=Coriobacterium glomerans (strain ATCC 49209 / DSM 20642 / JCM 10262 / PW2) TaxID=700015 RepID=F2N7K0_CORGP|nr:GntR family transcriptional regulator [Coriobacterium glomerans]AEB06816.1 transcriptional regulator, GntR family [Coriobacterium glomerans PW2]
MATKISSDASISLYQQVMVELKKEIEIGTYEPGSQIPTEAELTRIYSVGRVTVRRAVDELVCQGYLTKQQGRGTFVNAGKMTRKVHQKDDIQSFSCVCRANGMKAGGRLISRKVISADNELANLLSTAKGDELVLVERVRTADGIPVMLENDYFIRSEFSFLEREKLNGASIFELVSDRTGRTPQGSDPCTLEVVRANAEVAKHLSIPAGEPMFFMNVRFLDAKGLPLFVGHQYIVGSRYIFDI